jgi:CRP/FNR family transcriptional regulator
MPSPYNIEIENNCTVCGRAAERQFCNMSPEAMKTLDDIKFTSLYPKGSILFVEGEDPRGVFILCSGRAKLTTSSSEGRTLIVKLAEPGEVLGASATILGRPYEVSAETLEPSQLNFVKRDDFLRFLNAHAEACMHTAQQLSEKYQSAQREIRSLGLAQSTSEKLGKLLLEWCALHGETTPRGIRIKVLLTHEEVAQMIGTTRETVTRLLSDFKRRNIIEVKGSTIVILRKAELEALVSI